MNTRKKQKLLSLIKQYKQTKVLKQNIEQTSMSTLVHMGFGHKGVLKPTVWKYANALMMRGQQLGLCKPYNFGRGKGQWVAEQGFNIDKVANKLQSDSKAKSILAKFNTYMRKIIQKDIQKNKVNSKNLSIQDFIKLGFQKKRYVDEKVWEYVDKVMRIGQKNNLVMKSVWHGDKNGGTQWTTKNKFLKDVIEQLANDETVKKIYLKYK